MGGILPLRNSHSREKRNDADKSPKNCHLFIGFQVLTSGPCRESQSSDRSRRRTLVGRLREERLCIALPLASCGKLCENPLHFFRFDDETTLPIAAHIVALVEDSAAIND
jgi:hypothetical protein